MGKGTSWPTASTADMDAVLRFLPILEAEGFSAGEFVSEPGVVPCYDFNPQVVELVQALYDNHWVVSGFPWMEWEEGRRLAHDLEAVAQVDIQTLQKLFTAIVRNDRFCEGALGAAIDDGLITAMLRRVRELRPSNTGEGVDDGG